MGALAVHQLSVKIHGLKNQYTDAKKSASEATLTEFRRQMAEAYAELASTSTELSQKNFEKVAAATNGVTAKA